MNSTKILTGVIAATIMNVASSSGMVVIEKQNQAVMMNELLEGITVVMARPECTIKNSIDSI